MTAFYSGNGSIQVSKAIVESEGFNDVLHKLYELDPEFQFEEIEEGFYNLNFSNNYSYNAISEMDDLLKELGKFLPTAQTIFYEYEGDNGELVIGPDDESVKKETIKNYVNTVSNAIQMLTSFGEEYESEYQMIVSVLDRIKTKAGIE